MILEHAWFTYMFSLCSLQGFCSVVEELGSTQCYPVFCPRCYLKRKKQKPNKKTNSKVQLVSEMLHNTELWKRRHHPARTWEHWLSSQASVMFPKLLIVIHAGLWMHVNSRKQKEQVPFISEKNVLHLALYFLQSLQNTLWNQSTSVPFLFHLRCCHKVSPIVLNMYFDL